MELRKRVCAFRKNLLKDQFVRVQFFYNAAESEFLDVLPKCYHPSVGSVFGEETKDF